VTDRSPIEDKATEWREFQAFRRLAEQAMVECQLDTDNARMRIYDLFLEGIRSAYFTQVIIPTASEGQSQNQLARKFGVDKATYCRWLEEKIVPPKSEAFVLVAAATNAEFPRSSSAVLQGYVQAYSGIQSRLKKAHDPLSRSHALCLRLIFRTRDWWLAAKTGDLELFESAGHDVNNRMYDYGLEDKYFPATLLQSLIKGHWLAWTVLELTLQHEWL
jgi:transcriptional regulator with XRE-family HTH domain